jgi:CRP-like cAMP-binding protein
MLSMAISALALQQPANVHSANMHSSKVHAIESFQRGDRIPLQSPISWQITSGFVRTSTWNEDGELVTLGIWGAGDFVGHPFSQVHPYEIECLTRVKAIQRRIPGQRIEEIFLRHISQMQELLSIIGYKRAPLRLLKFLDWLATRFGEPMEQGRLIDLRLTHQILAEIVGITRVTTTRLLNQFERDGYLDRLGQNQILLKKI